MKVDGDLRYCGDMDNVANVSGWISDAPVVPFASSPVTMDLDAKAWTVELNYLDAVAACAALESRLGPPDARIPGFYRRWSFAGTTVTQRGRRVTVSESF